MKSLDKIPPLRPSEYREAKPDGFWIWTVMIFTGGLVLGFFIGVAV